MFHMAAYFTAALAQAANFDVPALTDNVLTIANGHFLPQKDMDILFAYGAATTINRARIVSPSNRQITLPFVRPTNLGQNPITQQGIADFRGNPFQISGLEELAVEATSDLGCGTEDCTILLGMTVNPQSAPRGNVFTMRVTSVTASVADTWTTVTLVFPDTLPHGTYAVVGLEYVAVTGTAARIIFDDQTWRPGCVGQVLINNQAPQLFKKGGLGEWGRFRSTAMPQFQVLNSAAVSVHTFFMDIVRVL